MSLECQPGVQGKNVTPPQGCSLVFVLSMVPLNRTFQKFPTEYITFKFLLYRFQFSYLLSHSSSFLWILIPYSLHYSFIRRVFGGMLSFVRYCLLSVDNTWWGEVISLLLYLQTCRQEKTDKEGCLWMHKSKLEGLPFHIASKRHYECLRFDPVFHSVFSPFTHRPPPS